MRTINLTKGKVALVDDDAPSWIFTVSWYAQKDPGGVYYACRRNKKSEGGRELQYLHRIIAQTPEGFDTLHIDGNGLNNQRRNLRIGSRRDNLQSKLKIRSSSGFRGVDFSKRAKLFRARLCVAGQTINLGYYTDAKLAAQVRDSWARLLGWPEEGMNFPKP